VAHTIPTTLSARTPWDNDLGEVVVPWTSVGAMPLSFWTCDINDDHVKLAYTDFVYYRLLGVKVSLLDDLTIARQTSGVYI